MKTRKNNRNENPKNHKEYRKIKMEFHRVFYKQII